MLAQLILQFSALHLCIVRSGEGKQEKKGKNDFPAGEPPAVQSQPMPGLPQLLHAIKENILAEMKNKTSPNFPNLGKEKNEILKLSLKIY
jgi:hypothetical protein